MPGEQNIAMTFPFLRLTFAGLLLGAFAGAHATFLPPISNAIESTVLRERRAIEVYLPEEANKDPTQRFDTLYVLDGDWNTKLVVDVVQFMHELGLMPPIIVVGIPNYFDAQGANSRDHDFTPAAVAELPRSGGAANFLGFLKTEVLPNVDQRYPTNGVHLVHGHSLGGLFVMYALATDPSMFDGYVSLDPAIHYWGNHALDALLSVNVPNLPVKGKAIFVGGRAGGAYSEMGLDNLESILRSRAKPTLHWKMTAYEDESHNSLKLKATYDGLKYAYGGYTRDQVEIFPASGVLIPGRPVEVGVSWLQSGLHYTTDGLEPDESSPEVHGGAFSIADPRKFRLRLLSNRGVFDREIPLPLRAGESFQPEAAPGPGAADAAWHYALFAPEAWPRLDTGHPFAQGECGKELDFGTLATKRLAGRVQREIEVPEEGYYAFVVRADQVRLSLGQNPLIENDGAHASGIQAYLAPLQRGRYALSFEFMKANQNSVVLLGVFRTSDNRPEWWKGSPWLGLIAR